MTAITGPAAGPYVDSIERHFRRVPAWPAPGVQFRGITHSLSNPRCYAPCSAMLINDSIATVEAMLAGKRLLERLGTTSLEGAAAIALPELSGRRRLREAGLPSIDAGPSRRTLIGYQGNACPRSRFARSRHARTSPPERNNSSANAGW